LGVDRDLTESSQIHHLGLTQPLYLSTVVGSPTTSETEGL